MELKEIEELVDKLKQYPGITSKQAHKIVYFLLEKKTNEIQNEFGEFQSLLTKIKKCKICKNYTIEEICDICSSATREKKLMIVENSQQIQKFEDWKYFNGKYFQIPFLYNKKFELINNYDLSFFLEYINSFEEIIISLSPTAEGLLTSNYLFEQIKNKNPQIKVTKLATGIQMGSLLDYTDQSTIFYALRDRKEIK